MIINVCDCYYMKHRIVYCLFWFQSVAFMCNTGACFILCRHIW